MKNGKKLFHEIHFYLTYLLSRWVIRDGSQGVYVFFSVLEK